MFLTIPRVEHHTGIDHKTILRLIGTGKIASGGHRHQSEIEILETGNRRELEPIERGRPIKETASRPGKVGGVFDGRLTTGSIATKIRPSTDDAHSGKVRRLSATETVRRRAPDFLNRDSIRWRDGVVRMNSETYSLIGKMGLDQFAVNVAG